MNSYIIREAQRRDVPAVMALWREMMEFHSEYDSRFRFAPTALKELERHLVETIRSREARILIAEFNGQIVGYVLGEVHKRKPLYPMGCYGFISDISVTSAWRKRGVGRTLVENLVEWFRMKGVTAVELFVAEANPISMAFWDSMGFKEFLRLRRKELE